MSKYIIKNCPCIKHSDEIEIDNGCMSTQDGMYCFCEDNTDCVMKQIVELCEEESSLIQHKQRVKVKGLNKLADKIFGLLDIQEVE